MALQFTAQHVPCSPATSRDVSSGSKRPAAPSAPPSAATDSNAFAQYRDTDNGESCALNDSESPTSCKKPRYLSSLRGGDSETTAETWLLPTSSSTGTCSGWEASDSLCSTNTGAGALHGGTAHSDNYVSSVANRIDSTRGDPPDDADGQAAEVAASRLEAQIDDLTSDMDHWCLTDLKGWRRRRAAVAVTASIRTGSGSMEDDDGVDRTAEDGDTVGNKGGSSLSPGSPLKRAQNSSTSPSVPQSPSEKEFLRQRRREARRSMLRGIASISSNGTCRRKLEV